MRVVRDPRDVNLGGPVTATAHQDEVGAVKRDVRCKTDGCENLANARYDRGPFAGLCWETCVPAARVEASRRSVEARARASAPPEPPAEAEEGLGVGDDGHHEQDDLPLARLGAASRPHDDAAGDDASFADVAAELEAAKQRLEQAEADYAAARRRFVSHDVYRALRDSDLAGEG